MSAIVLIGPPGAGKTSVGRALARRLDLSFTDTDQVVEADAGMSVADIFLTEGEGGFRARERLAVIGALAQSDAARPQSDAANSQSDGVNSQSDGVIALGGGAVLDPTIQDHLAGHQVIFLDVSIAQAAPRIGLARSRPLLVGSPRARWSELMAARRDTYERLATLIIDTDGLTVAQICARIATAITANAASGGGPAGGTS